MEANQGSRQYKTLVQHYKQYQRHYSGCAHAGRAVAAEQGWLQLLPGVACFVLDEPAEPTEPEAAFVDLMVHLSHPDSVVFDRGLSRFTACLGHFDSPDEPWGFAVRTAIQHLLPGLSPELAQALLDQAVNVPGAVHLWSQFQWPEAQCGQGGIEWHIERSALEALYCHHNAELILSLPDEQMTAPLVQALGIAAHLTPNVALSRLDTLLDRFPEAVCSAYWLAASRDATGQLLEALQRPHLAAIAEPYWALYSGQNLAWDPSMGVLGNPPHSGAAMPDYDSAVQWWQGSPAHNVPLWRGAPLTDTELSQVLGRHWGTHTAPLWAWWQYQQRRYMADPLTQWHYSRLIALGLSPLEAAGAPE